MAKKNLYTFEIKDKVKKKVEEKTDEGILIREVEEEIPVQIVLKKPNSRDVLELQKVKQIKLSECIRNGILTKKNMRAALLESGGFGLSNFDKERLGQLYKRVQGKEAEYHQAKLNGADVTQISQDFNDLTAEIQKEELLLHEVFSYDDSADSIAEREMITWAAINLSFYVRDGKEETVFPGAEWKYKFNTYLEMCDDPENNILPIRIFNKAFLSYFFYLFNPNNYKTEEQMQDLEIHVDAFGT